MVEQVFLKDSGAIVENWSWTLDTLDTGVDLNILKIQSNKGPG